MGGVGPGEARATAGIELRGIREGGLAGLDLRLPLERIVCLRGHSGSGAQTLARRVLLGESRRRYLLSLTPFERERLGGVGAAADVDAVDGLPPSQPLPGTADGDVAGWLHLEADLQCLVRAHARVPCAHCGGDARTFHEEQVAVALDEAFAEESCLIVAPMPLEPAAADGVVAELGRAGFRRVRTASGLVRLDEVTQATALVEAGFLQVVVDRLAPGSRGRSRVGEAVRTARAVAGGRALLVGDTSQEQLWVDSRRACVRCGQLCAEPDWEAVVRGDESAAVELAGELAGPALHRLSLGSLATWIDVVGGADAAAGASTARLNEGRAAATAAAHRLRQAHAVAAALDLGRLPLWRPTARLAHGERLLLGIAAAQVTGLTGILHVVESPLSGLDAATRRAAVDGLQRLVAGGSSVVVLDGDPAASSWADTVVELDGPARGEAPAAPATPTVGGGRRSLPAAPAGPVDHAVVGPGGRDGALPAGSQLEIPLAAFVVLAGPTGAGKSALLRHLHASLHDHARSARRVVAPGVRRCVDLTPADAAEAGDRAVLADLLGVLRPLARLFAAGAAAQEAGLNADSFSLECAGGRCPACEGRGVIRHRLDLVEDIAVPCLRCGGRRFRDEVLAVTAHGLSLAEVLELPVAVAAQRLERERGVAKPLRAAQAAGLGYRRLDTAPAALEGIEGLLARLARQSLTARPGDLVLVDRPVAGCTRADAALVVAALRRLVTLGAGIVVSDAAGILAGEADVVIDLGE